MSAYERPEAVEEGAVMMTSGLNAERVRQGLEILNEQHKKAGRNFRLVEDYNAPNVSDKVLRVIVSYTDYVRRYVWHSKETND